MTRQLGPDEIEFRHEPHQHRPKNSVDTSASNGGFSSLSFDTVTSLSQFPQPPDSLPATPRQAAFHRESPPTTPRQPPRVPVRPSPLVHAYSSTPPLNIPVHPSPSSLASSAPPVSFRSPAQKGSPFHWHDGVSSIDEVDPLENRMLSTSFITNLLREEQPGSPSQPFATLTPSSSSDHTYTSLPPDTPPGYPPLPRHPTQNSTPGGINSSLYGAQQPSPQITPRDVSNPSTNRMSYGSATSAADTATNASTDEPSTCTIARIRTAQVSREPSLLRNVIGMAPATTLSPRHEEQRPDSPFSDMMEEKLGDTNVNFEDYPLSYTPSMDTTTPLYPSDVRAPRRASMQSAKSHSPSFMSRLSSYSGHRSVKNAMKRMRKPLPPIPIVAHVPVVVHQDAVASQDELSPLPDLMMRADTLEYMLARGQHPHRSLNSATGVGQRKPGLPIVENSTGAHPHLTLDAEPYARRTFYSNGGLPIPPADPPTPKKERHTHRFPLTVKLDPRKHKFVIIAIFILVAIIAVSVGLGVGLSSKGKDKSLPVCSTANITGSACDLDATCVCTSTAPGSCVPLANSLVQLTPTVNSLFATNLTTAQVGTALWMAHGDLVGENCATQALLVDVAPALTASNSPNRTTWARAALLWQLVFSQDLDAVEALRNFIVDQAPWSKLGGGDGPISASGDFQYTSLGFTFDFAALAVTQSAVSFVSDGQPTSEQLSRVGQTGRSALDRMYSYSTASDIQRKSALSVYWRSVLQQQASDLPSFITLFAGSPVVVPFDVTYGRSPSRIANMLNDSNAGTPFPPPLSCYPGLDAPTRGRLQAVEGSVFGISQPTDSPSKFDPSCYPDRPIYGILDVLRLRLPFVDSRTGVARQGVVLKRDVKSRAVFHSGELLSALPGTTQTPNVNQPYLLNPREYGTSKRLQHVILNYLESMPDVNTARAVVSYVLANEVVPPNDQLILSALDKLPVIEVAVLGSIGKGDVSYSVAPFATGGKFFFGTDDGMALRHWSISTMGVPIAWTEFAYSEEIVADATLDDPIFTQTWNAVATFLHTPNSNADVSVKNVTDSFTLNNKFTASLS